MKQEQRKKGFIEKYDMKPIVAVMDDAIARLSMNTIISCDCQKYPEDAYKSGIDLLTDDFARECIDCGRVILPDEFTEYQEEHDYEIKNT